MKRTLCTSQSACKHSRENLAEIKWREKEVPMTLEMCTFTYSIEYAERKKAFFSEILWNCAKKKSFLVDYKLAYTLRK